MANKCPSIKALACSGAALEPAASRKRSFSWSKPHEEECRLGSNRASVFTRQMEGGERLTGDAREKTKQSSQGLLGYLDLVRCSAGTERGGDEARQEQTKQAPDEELDDGAIQVGQGRQRQHLLK
jgi:hypothetical protein